MPRSYKYVHDLLTDEKNRQADLYDISTNKHRAFQTSPHESFEEDTCTRLIEDYLVSVCLILYQPTVAVDQTIYGKSVCYPPLTGIKKSDVKRWILEASLPIPKNDYESLVKRKTLPDKLIQGDKYTKVVWVTLSGSVYTPMDNVGIQITPRRYSLSKGWHTC